LDDAGDFALGIALGEGETGQRAGGDDGPGAGESAMHDDLLGFDRCHDGA
jgi:hypothetical protein